MKTQEACISNIKIKIHEDVVARVEGLKFVAEKYSGRIKIYLVEKESTVFLEEVPTDSIIPSAKVDELWNNVEMSLLKALVLYVVKENSEEERNLSAVYSLLVLNDAATIDSMFNALPPSHLAKKQYKTYKQAPAKIKDIMSKILASRLKVFQNRYAQDLATINDLDCILTTKINSSDDMKYWVKCWLEYQIKSTLNQVNIKNFIEEISRRKSKFNKMMVDHIEKKCDCKIGDICLASMYLSGKISLFDAMFDFEL